MPWSVEISIEPAHALLVGLCTRTCVIVRLKHRSASALSAKLPSIATTSLMPATAVAVVGAAVVGDAVVGDAEVVDVHASQ